jgi:hypothetical protein
MGFITQLEPETEGFAIEVAESAADDGANRPKKPHRN